ncbi:hypothetical protein FNF29_01085 [Cafeteria roenbergensis]|uniref:PAS domain-containing protein n=1 Tax=Cafeteria roenbergensis TaxID=33653 RepID=A0A5A8CT11_CAFRO|nr:hypothetical protein FNF29_01085 [Cafeteria roenbergensis]|eukprot:KAA0156292.1 hypothetical protein FNF29_01085 [Cafeteria roenbergensis]
MAGQAASPLELWIARIQNSWLQVLVLVNKDTRSSAASVAASELVSFLQLLTVPITVCLELARRVPGSAPQTALSELLFGLSVVNPDSIKQVFGETVFIALFALALMSVTAFVVMAIVVAATVASKTAKHSPYLLRTLRATAKLSSTSLFLPWTSLLLQALGCDGSIWWGGAGVACYGPVHLPLAIFVILLLPFFITASLTVASVYIDRVPTSAQLDARTHGRADVLLLIVKLVLTALLTYGTSTAPQWLLVGVLAVSGVLWLFLFLTMVPFARLVMNAAHVGMATAFLWATLCAVIVWASEGAQDVGVILVLGTPLAGVLGFTGAYMRFYGILEQDDPYGMRSMWMVTLWTRERLREAHRSKRRHEGIPIPGLQVAEPPPSVHVSRWGIKPAEGQSWSSALEASAVTGIEALEDLFASVGIAHSIASTFYKVTTQLSHYKERQALTLARAVSRSFDIDFFFYQSLEDMQSGTDGGKRDVTRQTMSVVDRVLFDQYKVTALESEADCYAVHVMLMKHVAGRGMDVGFLHAQLGARLDDAMRTAAKSFEAMMRINSESPEALTYAADFHLQLAGNTLVAADLLQRAQRIEENNRRIKERKIGHLAFNSRADDDLSPTDEQNASFTISTDRARLGEIIAVNAAAVRILGSSTLLGSNINTIIPRPISDVHDSFLAKFVQTGTSKFLDSTRLMVAQHSAGHLFPVRFRIFETPPSAEDMRPKLTGLIAPVTTDDGFFIIGDESFDFTILSVCLKSASILQRPVDALSDRGVPAAIVFPELFGSAGQGGVVDAPGPRAPVRVQSMRRGESASSAAFAAGLSGGAGSPRRRQGHGVRPGSARSAAGTVLADGEGDQKEAGAKPPHGSMVSDFVDQFPPVLRESFSQHTRVNLFVPAFLSEDDFDGGHSDGVSSVGDFSDDGGQHTRDDAHGAGMTAVGLPQVQEVDEPSESILPGDSRASLEPSGGDVDSVGPAMSDSAGSSLGGTGGEHPEDDADPATRRVEPQVIPVSLRCFALPKRTPTMPSGVLIAWSRVEKPARPGAGARAVPASAWGRDAAPKAKPGATAVSPAAGAEPAAGAPAASGAKARSVMFASSSDAAAGSSDASLKPPEGEQAEASGTLGLSPSTAASAKAWRTAATTSASARQKPPPSTSLVASPNPSAGGGPVAPAFSGVVDQPRGIDDHEMTVGDAESMQQSALRRSLKRVLDAMTKRPSSGVALMRRVLWATTAIFIVFAVVCLAALGPWATHIRRHVAGIRHAGHLIEELHQSHMVVQILATESALQATGQGGWPVTDMNATRTQLLRMPGRLDEAVSVFFSDIQALGGPLERLSTDPQSASVVSETESGDVTGGSALSAGIDWESSGALPELASGGPAVALAGNTRSGRELVASSAGAAKISMSLFDALQTCQQSLQSLAELPQGSFTETNPSAAFVLNNARGNIGNVVNASLTTKLAELGNELAAIEEIELLTFICVIAITVVGQLILSMWASRTLWSDQIAMMRIFYEIPGKLASAMAARAELKLRRHRRQTVSVVGAAQESAVNEDSDGSIDRQREEGEEIRWQLMVERMSRVAQQDWAQEQAAAHGVTVDEYVGRRRTTRSSIQLDAFISGRRNSVGGAMEPGAAAAAAGRFAGAGIGGPDMERGRRGSVGRGGRAAPSRGDLRIRQQLLKERRDGIRIGDPSCTRTNLLLVNLAPSLLIAAWFATIYSLDLAMHNRVTIESERLVHLQQLSVWAGKLAHTAADSVFLPSVRSNATLQAALHEDALTERDALTRRSGLIENGGHSALAVALQAQSRRDFATLTPAPSNSPLQVVLHDQACPAVLAGAAGTYFAQRDIVTAASCLTVHDGVLSRGLSVAISRIVSHSRAAEVSFDRLWKASGQLQQAEANATWASENGVSPDRLQRQIRLLEHDARDLAGSVLQLYDPWVRSALSSMERTIVVSVEADVNATWEAQRNITIGFLAVFMLAVVTLFAPRLAWVERIVTATRRMLLVIPDEVLTGFPRIAESVREMEQALTTRSTLSHKLGSTARARKRAGSGAAPAKRPRRSAMRVRPSASEAGDRYVATPSGARAGMTASDSHTSFGSKAVTYRPELEGSSFQQGQASMSAPRSAGADGLDLTESVSQCRPGEAADAKRVPPRLEISGPAGRSVLSSQHPTADSDAARFASGSLRAAGTAGNSGTETPFVSSGGPPVVLSPAHAAPDGASGSADATGRRSPQARQPAPQAGDSPSALHTPDEDSDRDAETGNPVPPGLR